MMIFESEHFFVRMFSDDDAADCESFLADAQVMKFIGDGKFQLERTSALKVVRWFRQSCENTKGLGTWAIVDKKTNKVAGNCHLENCSAAAGVEFGLALARPYWRKGYATEICNALLAHGTTRLELNDIIATVHPENLASKRLLEKLGYRFDQFVELFGIRHELHRKS